MALVDLAQGLCRARAPVSRIGLEGMQAVDIETVSTGSLGLDIALGIGGLPRGRVVEIYGPESSGKTTMARLVAKAVNCLNEDPAQRPCNECTVCQSVTDGRFLDLIEIDAASNTGVDDIRDLRDKINFAPNQGRYKVYIIDEVHMLSTAAFNALLKTLEEPPAHVILCLTAEGLVIDLEPPSRDAQRRPQARTPARPRRHSKSATEGEPRPTKAVAKDAYSVYKRFAAGGIEIPYPKRDVYLQRTDDE